MMSPEFWWWLRLPNGEWVFFTESDLYKTRRRRTTHPPHEVKK